MNLEAFIAGYREGRDGLPPTVPDVMEENEDLESTKPNVHSDPEWAWRLIGWGLGQLVAMHELSGFGSLSDGKRSDGNG